MTTKHKKLVKKIIAAMSVVTFGAGLVNTSEAAIGRIPSISSRTHGTMQDRNNDRFNRNRNNRQNDNQATAPKEDISENTNVNDVQPQESTVENKNENNNSSVGSRRNEINNRKRQTPAKIVRDIDRSHDATYDEDDRYKAQRESYFEDDGNGRIVDEQREVIEERRQISATESDRERGRETIINRYDDEDGRRGSRGSRGNRDNGGITVVVNNNIPIENNINVDAKAENKNENNNNVKVENNTEVTSTNNNNNDNKNINEGKVEVPIIEKVDSPKNDLPKDEMPKIPSNVQIPADAYVYNGHSYYVYSGKVNNWEAARDYCSSLGGYLLIINDASENNALYDYMKSVGHSSAYFGLKKENGVWNWVNGQGLGYANWAPDEPNNAGGTEKYGMFYWKFVYTWNDGDFRGIASGDDQFICEWDYVLSR